MITATVSCDCIRGDVRDGMSSWDFSFPYDMADFKCVALDELDVLRQSGLTKPIIRWRGSCKVVGGRLVPRVYAGPKRLFPDVRYPGRGAQRQQMVDIVQDVLMGCVNVQDN